MASCYDLFADSDYGRNLLRIIFMAAFVAGLREKIGSDEREFKGLSGYQHHRLGWGDHKLVSVLGSDAHDACG